MLGKLLGITRPLIVFDFETTGVDPKTDRAVSLAMRVHNPDDTIKVFQTLINPQRSIPKASSDIHGITDETIAHGCAKCWKPADEHPHGSCETFKPVPAFNDIAINLHKGFGNSDFAGYNIKFDLSIAVEEFKRSGITFDHSAAKVIDAFALWKVVQPRTLEGAHEEFCGKPFEGAHNAMADVDASEAVLIAQLERHSVTLPRNVEELHAEIWPRDPNWIDAEGKFIFIDGVPCLNFGKEKGKPMRERTGYLRWMFGADFSPEVKKICDRALAGKFPIAP